MNKLGSSQILSLRYDFLNEVDVNLLDIVVDCQNKTQYSYKMVIFLDAGDIN